MNKRTRDKQNRGHQIVSQTPSDSTLHQHRRDISVQKRAVRKQISDHTLKTKSMLTCNIQFAASLLSNQPPLTTRPRPDPSVPSNQRTGKQRSPYAQARYLGASFISYQGFHLERLHW
ncbi:hypothetical protein CEXT_472181 [Caerostris extrusa]|uniref:Uncharacterized protein n=1 Tax=Caerostris extrusa TaxID=172846 RepID=A0AAV4UU86_CAEEX|nr:hypothetical protein CEXT_472181 [Caerostris extrusa]